MVCFPSTIYLFACLCQTLATYVVNVQLEELENRSDDAKSFAQAVMVADELRKPDVPDWAESSLWTALDGEPLLAYFGSRKSEQNKMEFDGIPVGYVPPHIYPIAHQT